MLEINLCRYMKNSKHHVLILSSVNQLLLVQLLLQLEIPLQLVNQLQPELVNRLQHGIHMFFLTAATGLWNTNYRIPNDCGEKRTEPVSMVTSAWKAWLYTQCYLYVISKLATIDCMTQKRRLTSPATPSNAVSDCPSTVIPQWFLQKCFQRRKKKGWKYFPT